MRSERDVLEGVVHLLRLEPGEVVEHVAPDGLGSFEAVAQLGALCLRLGDALLEVVDGVVEVGDPLGDEKPSAGERGRAGSFARVGRGRGRTLQTGQGEVTGK